MADTRLKVTFVDIEVNSDGDPIGKGELYWSCKVDGRVVSSRSVGNPLVIGSGGTINLGASTTVIKGSGAGEKLVVSGSVSERDDDDADELAPFSRDYTAVGNWGVDTIHRVDCMDRNLNATLTYIIERA
ncbi:MAG TPA: hypothetical protein VGD69_19795 [Herpetosiphonaceae bacterium]